MNSIGTTLIYATLTCCTNIPLCLWSRCVLWEGVKELRHISVGEKHPDVPFWDPGHPDWCLREWWRQGHGERLLLRVHLLGVLRRVWVSSIRAYYLLEVPPRPCGSPLCCLHLQFWPAWVACTRLWWWSTQITSWRASPLQQPLSCQPSHRSSCLDYR